MGKDPEKNSEYANRPEPDATHGPGEVEEEDTAISGVPTCPNCGWHNTRPSHTKTILDTVLQTFSFRPYRCRSCGNRFRVIRRAGRY
jgi:hypothetical protein